MLLIYKKYFTLIELLVVVAVFAILVSILTPSLRKAIYRARQVECVNNFSQWGKANLNYSEDYNGLYLGTNPIAYGWTGLNPWDIDPSCVRNAVASGLPNTARMVFCPLYTIDDIPADVRFWKEPPGHAINMTQTALEVNVHWSARWPGLALSNFNWWMIRQAGAAWVPNDPGQAGSSVKPKLWPERVQDGILDIPTMSDFLISNKVVNPFKLPELAEGGHSYDGLLDSNTLVYPDGRAILIPIEDIKFRNEGNELAFY